MQVEMNLFEVLQDMDDLEKEQDVQEEVKVSGSVGANKVSGLKVEKKENEVTKYILEAGEDDTILQSVLISTQPKLNPKFLGYCYSCGCPLHSQNYCPIRMCRYCFQYGHSTKVCPLRKYSPGMFSLK